MNGYQEKIEYYVIESAEFGKIYGFYNVTDNFELDFRAIGWLYLGAALDFSSLFLSSFWWLSR